MLEYDRDLEEASRQVLRNLTNLTWIWGDALSYDLRATPQRESILTGRSALWEPVLLHHFPDTLPGSVEVLLG